ncbi:MAG: formimidoylglutamase [Bacteroidetes bacterium]|nr:formimidoylglutamase [Bacteroidota bacterium]
MTLKHYINPVSENFFKQNDLELNHKFGKNIATFSCDKSFKNEYDVAIIGVSEQRDTLNKGCAEAPDIIREKLYNLSKINKNVKVIDLGNIKTGKTLSDTYFALTEVLCFLIQKNIIPVVIGGDRNLIYSIFLAYQKFANTINIVSIDSKLDLLQRDGNINQTYLSKIIEEKSESFFNYTNIGYQSYLVSPDEIQLMNTMFFDALRLGFAHGNIIETEPVLRDADILSFNIDSIKQSEAPGYYDPSPNGFYSEEVCQLAKYSGMSCKLSTFCMFGVNPKYDINNQTSHLAAQIVWHFIQGVSQCQNDSPDSESKNHTKFIVNNYKINQNITFYKSNLTSRWWVELPSSNNKKNKQIISCSFNDYRKFCNNEIPDRLWKMIQKID